MLAPGRLRVATDHHAPGRGRALARDGGRGVVHLVRSRRAKHRLGLPDRLHGRLDVRSRATRAHGSRRTRGPPRRVRSGRRSTGAHVVRRRRDHGDRRRARDARAARLARCALAHRAARLHVHRLVVDRTSRPDQRLRPAIDQCRLQLGPQRRDRRLPRARTLPDRRRAARLGARDRARHRMLTGRHDDGAPGLDSRRHAGRESGVLRERRVRPLVQRPVIRSVESIPAHRDCAHTSCARACHRRSCPPLAVGLARDWASRRSHSSSSRFRGMRRTSARTPRSDPPT